MELDFEKSKNDIILHGSEEELREDAYKKHRIDQGIKRCYAYKYSLREYVSILYLKWPKVNFYVKKY